MRYRHSNKTGDMDGVEMDGQKHVPEGSEAHEGSAQANQLTLTLFTLRGSAHANQPPLTAPRAAGGRSPSSSRPWWSFRRSLLLRVGVVTVRSIS